MNNTISMFQKIGKGVLKATVSVNLGSGITIHECKIIEEKREIKAVHPQRSEREKGGKLVYHDLIEFGDKNVWEQIESQILEYYRDQIGKI